MAKQTTPRKPLAGPPHKYAGHYHDKTGGHFCVLSKPDFELHRCTQDWQPVDPESPLHKNEVEFTAALGFGTFSKIIA